MQQSTLIRPAARRGHIANPLRALASLKLTLALLLALLAGAVLAYYLAPARTWGIVLPLAALAINLLAAIATHAKFRQQVPLLSFHLALLALIVLIALGRLSALSGQAEVTVGGEFDGHLASEQRGPWHLGGIESIRFANLGFDIDYDEGVRRGPTRNRVSWVDAGRPQTAVIGDQTPLVIGGYRFYTSFNKGFAPLLSWQDSDGIVRQGAIHLPAYPLHEYAQSQDWQPPGARQALWLMLKFDDVVLDPAAPSSFRLPNDPRLIVRHDSTGFELRPGDSIDLPEGRLRFDGLTAWMGYTVFYDWTLPWLAAACAVAVLSLAAHFWRKFAATPWDA